MKFDKIHSKEAIVMWHDMHPFRLLLLLFIEWLFLALLYSVQIKGLAQLCRINDFTRLEIGCTGVRFHQRSPTTLLNRYIYSYP